MFSRNGESWIEIFDKISINVGLDCVGEVLVRGENEVLILIIDSETGKKRKKLGK